MWSLYIGTQCNVSVYRLFVRIRDPSPCPYLRLKLVEVCGPYTETPVYIYYVIMDMSLITFRCMYVTCKTLYYVVHKPQNPFEAFLLILLTIKVLELHLTSRTGILFKPGILCQN